MLETLISSRIRRALFEHLLAHPTDQFYLRGLAKELHLSVSPLRRELARLESSGMLTATEEGNMRFYRVNVDSPAFVQLQQLGQPPAQPPSLERRPEVSLLSLSPRPQPTALAEPVLSSPRQRGWRSPLQTPALLAATVVGMALMLLVASLFYLTMTNDRLASAVRHVLTTRKTDVTVIAPQPSASGVMRGSRWQIIPGGFGGFSSGASNESY